MKNFMIWHLLKKISVVFLCLFLLGIAGDFLVYVTVEYGGKGTEFIGCYAYDALIVGFKCQGFSGSFIVTAWLNWPLWMIYAPMFAMGICYRCVVMGAVCSFNAYAS